jgi:hypothetical protein
MSQLLARLVEHPHEYAEARARLDELLLQLPCDVARGENDRTLPPTGLRPATSEEIAEWRQKLAAPPRLDSATVRPTLRARELLGMLREPSDLATPQVIKETLTRLEAGVIADNALSPLPAAQQVRFTELMAAWLRALWGTPHATDEDGRRADALLVELVRRHVSRGPGYRGGSAAAGRDQRRPTTDAGRLASAQP